MDDLGKLLLFKDVVDAGSFSRAAAQRGLTHSTVSKHVQTLEAELGVRLLNRTSRTMSLTEAGRLALTYGRRVGATLGELRGRLDELRGDVVGELRVNSLVHVGHHIVQPAVRRFLDAYPRARVHLTLDDGPLHFSRDGHDLAVRVGLHAEGSLTAVKLVDNPVCIVAAPRLVERIDLPHHPSDLATLPTVGYRSTEVDISAWAYLEDGEVRTVEVDPVCRVNDGNALLDLVASGLGIGYLSVFAASDHLRSGALVRLLTDFELPAYEPVFVIQAASSHPDPKVRTFRHHLTEVARDLVDLEIQPCPP